MDILAFPAMFEGIVKMSDRYIAIGSLVFSPKRNGGVGVVGAAIRSTSLKADLKSSAMRVRTRWAFE